jgi:hypothetical protein
VPVGRLPDLPPVGEQPVAVRREHFNQQVVGALQGLNYLPFIEIVFIALPLLFHAGYGLAIIGSGRAEPLRYGYAAQPASTGCSASPASA